ncbi:hypothetical protein A9Q84_02120 [Halobacteriovorax marinus]|uniref:Uncharacterized protein n=1 Tax=Halobacteriovorax marinus TaxID=97084 RepID=A0A1Y5FJ12_9BACT|nr:hypothetical protein A9Q84_02120 [Halobacteriovorax marinus]
MYLDRIYRKLGWWDFLDRIEFELKESPDKSVYINFLDELRMRRLESVSEGATYKLRAPANDLFDKFQKRLSLDSTFADEADVKECRELLADII